MDVALHRRAEIALRSLGSAQRATVDAALERLRDADPAALRRSKLRVLPDSRLPDLYVAVLDPDLRAVLEFTGPDTILVSEIAPAERARVVNERGGDEAADATRFRQA